MHLHHVIALDEHTDKLVTVLINIPNHCAHIYTRSLTEMYLVLAHQYWHAQLNFAIHQLVK